LHGRNAAGIVDEYMNGAKMPHRFSDQSLDVGEALHIARDR
jgi:hypothetical protein